MNSRDRILTVLKGQIPDRVPVSLFIHDEGNFLKQVYPDLDIKDYIGNKLKVIDLQRELGADIDVRLWGGCLPLWLICGSVNTESQTDNWNVEKKTIRRGKSKVEKAVIKTPLGNLYQVNVIKGGTPKLVKQKVKEAMEAGKPGGKFIL